jgi:hypothetical protein
MAAMSSGLSAVPVPIVVIASGPMLCTIITLDHEPTVPKAPSVWPTRR